jgi:N-acetylmuramoyl-L-alanine amidase
MRQKQQIKKALIRDLVEENLEAIEQRPKGFLRRKRHRRQAALGRWLVSGAAGMIVGALIFFLFLDTGGRLYRQWLAGGQPLAAVDTGGSVADTLGELVLPANFTRPGPLEPSIIPLAVRHIAIDAGHGGSEEGTITDTGLIEKELTLDIAKRLKRMLESADYTVTMTRTSDELIQLKDRAQTANAARADLFLSIHVNWIPNRAVRGVETYFLGPTDDPHINDLAALENRDSGYSVADYRRLLDSIYADARSSESRRLATAVQRSLYSSLRRTTPDLSNRGVKSAPFVVLVATEMPAILAEVSCLSNEHEAKLLAKPAYRQQIARALFEGIRYYSSPPETANRGGGKGKES